MMKFKTIAVAAALALIPSISSAVTVVNGDFESDTELWSVWPGYGAGGSNPAVLTGWFDLNDVAGQKPYGLNPVAPGAPADSPFDGSNTTNTGHFAFLQGSAGIGQVVGGFTVGADYTLSLDFNSRDCCGDFPTATVLLDDTPVAASSALFGGDGAIPHAGADTPWYHADIPFTATAESITLKIQSAPAAGGDATLVVDNVSITPVPEPTTGLLALLGLGALALRRKR